jgi:predicted DCC family thiol-disulfide oxidoreductase YuxK
MKNYKHIILFDGVCNLCNHAVMFIIRHDSEAKFRFASLQSETGNLFLQEAGLPEGHFQTLIYLKGEKYYLRSAAVLYVFKELGGFWKLLFVFIIIPGFIRDLFYNMIARTRYTLFGKYDKCAVPSPEIRERFLD